jgi:photosystem II stability/assembly factor-like uncharacterized protein
VVDDVVESWRDATGNLAGVRSECGNVNYVSVNDSGELLTAVALAGPWASSDGGQTWTEIGDAPESADVTVRLTSVVYDPVDSERFWITGIYNRGGVYATVDGGETFEQLGTVFDPAALSIDFADAGRQLLVAVNQDDVGVSKSVDGGVTWESIDEALPREGGRTTGVLVIDDQTYLVGIADGSVPGIFRTVDGGATWLRVHPGGVSGQPLRTADGQLRWLLERGGGLVSSVDDGATWTSALGRGISPFASSLVELPDGRMVTFSASNLIASTDAGTTWRNIGPALPFEPTGITYSPSDAAFYAWRYTCELTGDNAVRPGTIMRVDFASS